MRLDIIKFPKPFAGCPQAIIIKALGGILYPRERIEIFDMNGEGFNSGTLENVIQQV
jgi:hypothetical protein